LLTSPALLAQRGGHVAGTGHSAAGASSPASNTSDMNDFNHAVALQAAPEQIVQFQQLTKSMAAAREQARNLMQHSANAIKADSSSYADLNDAVEEAQTDNRQFVMSFSAPQQSGLKPLTKNLSKADSDLSKRGKALTQELGRTEMDSKKTAAAVEKLDKALTDFQSEVLDIGREMGIPPPQHSQ